MHRTTLTVPAADYALTIALFFALITAVGVYWQARRDHLHRTAALTLAGGALAGTFYLLQKIAETTGIG